jgi:hypothetical protein
MGPDLSATPMHARRAIEAEFAQRLFNSARAAVGEEQAFAILNAAIDEAAFESGRAFAAKAPGGAPSLEHFSQVVDLWRAGGALDIADIRLGADAFSFTVTRCGYMEMYRAMGIAAPLHASLSCRRDAAFAAGYSPRLAMERPATISGGAAGCLFTFRWRG